MLLFRCRIIIPVLRSIETGTLLNPLFGLYFAVVVEVGTEVAVSANAATGIVLQ